MCIYICVYIYMIYIYGQKWYCYCRIKKKTFKFFVN